MNLSRQRELPGGKPEEKILFLLEFAVLAPSTHNSQPWLFKVCESSCLVYGDSSREIPIADKEKRDFFISLGACLENLVVAARFFRVFDRLEYRTEGEGGEVAEVFFNGLDDAEGVDEQFRDIFISLSQRVNVRGVFDRRRVELSGVSEMVRAKCSDEEIDIYLTDSPGEIGRLGELTGEGLKVAYRDPSFRMEISGWVNNSLSRKREGIPAYSLKVPVFLSFLLPFIIRNFNIGNKLAKLNKMSIESASVAAIFTSSGNTSLQLLKIGRAAERMILNLDTKGISSSIFVAAVEMGDIYKTVQSEFGLKNRPQFLLCAGFMGAKQRHTPRLPVKSKLISRSRRC